MKAQISRNKLFQSEKRVMKETTKAKTDSRAGEEPSL